MQGLYSEQNGGEGAHVLAVGMNSVLVAGLGIRIAPGVSNVSVAQVSFVSCFDEDMQCSRSSGAARGGPSLGHE